MPPPVRTRPGPATQRATKLDKSVEGPVEASPLWGLVVVLGEVAVRLSRQSVRSDGSIQTETVGIAAAKAVNEAT
jgi:hypothetical protein